MREDGAEILIDEPMAQRGRRMLRALADVAPRVVVRERYGGEHKLLVMYGVGLESRHALLRSHLAAGGRVAVWDLGYWDREDAMRLSLDGLHPTASALGAPHGPARRIFALREDGAKAGPILLVGIGTKTAAMTGAPPMAWERTALAKIRKRFPDTRILWRPKGRVAIGLEGTTLCHGQPIEAALAGCSLVVCKNSNVAVDACVAGVPVWCEGGAAHTLYGDNPSSPSREQRADFLRRLSWWNWRPSEAEQAWRWIREAIA